MQEYDVALKLLLQGGAKLTIRELAGGAVEKWLDIELPKVQNMRMDLLGETAGGGLVHVELQSGNDIAMPLRMAEYCLGVFRLFGKFPRQVLLYVGEAPLRMASELRGPDVSFRYRAIDIRELDGDRLIESDEVGDNVIAILARLRDHRVAVRKIVGRIASLAAAEREAALSRLLILAGLRRLEETVAREIQKMPVFIDILENKVLGPPFRRGLEEGRQAGLQEGLQEGELKGELRILRRQIEKRFGAIPAWAEERLAVRSTAELEDLSVRVLDAQSMEDLLR
jgi:predicted transposase YdaD